MILRSRRSRRGLSRGPDDAVEVALVARGAFGQALQHRFPGGRQRQVIAAPVAFAARLRAMRPRRFEIAQGRGERGLVPAGGAAEHGLADAGVAADERQQREAAGRQVDLADLAREGLEGGDLRHAQMEAEPVRQRAIVDAVDERPCRGRERRASASAGLRPSKAIAPRLPSLPRPEPRACAVASSPLEIQSSLAVREIVLYPTNSLYKFRRIGLN